MYCKDSRKEGRSKFFWTVKMNHSVYENLKKGDEWQYIELNLVNMKSLFQIIALYA